MSTALPALLRLTGARGWRWALAAILGALTVLFGVGLMATAGYLISRAAERPPILSLMVAIVAVQFFGLGRPALRYLERLWSHDLALRMLGGVRARFCARIAPLAPAELAGYRAGDLLSRLVGDVDALQNLYLRGLGPPLVAVLAGAVAVGAAAAVLPAAGAALAGGLLAGGIGVPALSGSVGVRARRRQAAARGALAAEVIELMRGAPEIVAAGAEVAALDRVRSADRAAVATARRDALAGGIGDGLGIVVTGATVLAVLILAVEASATGRLDRVLIAALALLTIAAFEAVAPVAAAGRELAATVAAGRRVLEVIDREPRVRDPAVPAAPPAPPVTLALEGVTARYPGQERPALRDVSLTLAPGERVALVGPSGAGKTTVVNLLLRFLDPEAGRVTLAGRSLTEYRQSDIRRLIAVAGQESHLFSAGIGANVRLARPQASDAEVERALRLARIWDWVSRLPDGLDTWVGEEGRQLSGGQRQRIILARALLADAPVLVLDEPTAHLDPPTAGQLMTDVFAAAAGKTLLLITHRSEGLDLVDRVMQLPGR
ncbi:MAG TPA: thiol reductant ABC exporter subunit CydC [Solirubrobacteraceae bacterium]|nr:thiol reductant ABC exporter subunit CydC [Solirubrobacteraceae bacterium]